MFDDLFDDAFDRDFFDDPFFTRARQNLIGDGKAPEEKGSETKDMAPAKYRRGGRGMAAIKTDIREKDDGYELSVELPGFTKDDVSISLDKGYLTITASVNEDKEDKDDAKGYIRRERYQGHRSRSYFVGRDVKPEDIKAKMENGVLTVDFPKARPKEDTVKTILIEG